MRWSSRRCVLPVLASVPLAAVCAALWCGQRPRVGPVGPDWTAERLHAALTRAGLGYEGARISGEQPGYYLKERRDGRTWEELASEPHWADTAHRLRGYVVIVPGRAGRLAGGGSPEEGLLQLGNLILMGDPAMLRRIAEALR